MFICAWMIFSHWAWAALTTLGWQWPVATTAMPITKSSHLLPSVPYTQLPAAWSTVTGVTWETIPGT